MAEHDAGHADEDLDLIIVGAGISGIDGGYRFQTAFPDKSYAILEARDAIGGTWDLFRYPGIRSDSDMYTLGFPFRPWRGERSIAGGEAIRDYVEETARAFGIDRRIRFRHRVLAARWETAAARWAVDVETPDGSRRLACRFLYVCSGYYDYAGGYRPHWPGEEVFAGRIVHPQHWPDDLDYAGKRVVVIGSGATAVTLVPAMTDEAAHVTMLQRSPSYVVSLPSRDAVAHWLGRALPARPAAAAVRLKNIALSRLFFGLARRRPERTRQAILKRVRKALPEPFDVERHFSPRYDPWDQRLCLVPDNDLFEAIAAGKASVATDEIVRFTADGLQLKSGAELPADVVVTATGLVVKLMGGIAVSVDGVPVSGAGRLVYRGMMLEDLPNFAFAFGYTNASWTLKCDLTARYLCRLIRHMERRGARIATPRLRDATVTREPLLDFTSGYIARAAGALPVRGSTGPWRLPQNYLRDLAAFALGRIADPSLELR
jgi:cation diffusion facilitator CzcD-associated flavoprotein CzcO